MNDRNKTVRDVVREARERSIAVQEPKVNAWVSSGGEQIVLDGAREAGLDITIAGEYSTKGGDAPLHVVLEIVKWLAIIRGIVGDEIKNAILDVAIRDPLKDSFKKIAKFVYEFKKNSPTTNSSVILKAEDDDGFDRTYFLSMDDTDEAVNAILVDLGVPVPSGPRASQRFWVDGRWMDSAEYL